MDIKQNTSSEPSHETVAFRENSTVLIWRNSQNQSYDPHWHTALEVIIPLENDYHVTVNENHFHLHCCKIFQFHLPGFSRPQSQDDTSFCTQ